MNLKKEIISELKKLGFRQHKDFHSALYVWNPNDEIIMYCEPKFIYDDPTGVLLIGFTYKKSEGLGYYSGDRSSDNKYGYSGCYMRYYLSHSGKIKIDSSYNTCCDDNWDISQKEELFGYLRNEMITFFKYMTTKANFTKLALEKGADIAAIIYEERGEIDKTIEILSRNYRIALGLKDIETLRKSEYLEYLKNGTSLLDIQDPEEKTSILQLTRNDIYIALNKKTIKDSDVLEYFEGIKNFYKPQKMSYVDLNNDSGIAICKVGKWSILRIGIDLFMQFDQEKIENMLSDMSAKYNRAILCVNQDTTNTFGFEVYKKGEFLRRWMAGDGEVMENIGNPIIGEKKRFNDIIKNEQDSQSVVEFLDGLLKINYGDLEKSKTLLYEC